MKKKLFFAIVLLCTLAMTFAYGEEKLSSTQIIVDGSASISLPADYAVVELGVTYSDKTLTIAADHNAKQMNDIIAKLESLGVSQDEMHTNNFSMSPQYNYDYGKLGENETLAGYTVSNTLSVTIRDLENISKILDAAIGAGANTSYGLSFYSLKNEEAYLEALKNAVEDGLKKAMVLAESIGGHLGSVVSVKENAGYASSNRKMMTMMDEAQSSTPILAEKIMVSANVTVVYDLVK